MMNSTTSSDYRASDNNNQTILEVFKQHIVHNSLPGCQRPCNLHPFFQNLTKNQNFMLQSSSKRNQTSYFKFKQLVQFVKDKPH